MCGVKLATYWIVGVLLKGSTPRVYIEGLEELN
jgi:hypothetical protein